METPQALEMVATFHQVFQHPVLPGPAVPAANRCRLRMALLEEELAELGEAIENQDIVGIADALCDLQYVLSGAVLEFGLGHRFKELFEEVQRSNMSKTCRSEEEARQTVAHYQAQGTDCYYKASCGVFLVFRTQDNKTLKSVNYSPPRLGEMLGHG